MRLRFIISLTVVTLAILAIIFLLRPANQRTISELKPAVIQLTNGAILVSSVVASPSSNIVVSNSPASAGGNIFNATNIIATDREKLESEEAITRMNKPIIFYGQVIDQDGQPISGGQVKMNAEHFFYLVAQGMATTNIEMQTLTDAKGRFEWTSETGDLVSVETITKDGYEVEAGNCPHTFGIQSGTLENPVIFKMWSTNIHEQLITGEKTFEILPDGRPHFINLTDDTISEITGGDLKVWIQYTNQTVRGQPYDWSAGIEIINGGLLEQSRGTAMYSAPASGYTNSFQIQQQIKGGQSGEIGDRSFFLLLKNGQEYGRMDINLYAPYGYLHPGLIRLSYAINPSGSRILR